MLIGQRSFDSVRFRTTHIGLDGGFEAHRTGQIGAFQQNVRTILGKVIHLQFDLVEKPHLKTEIELACYFPCNVVIRVTTHCNSRPYHIEIGTVPDIFAGIVHVDIREIEKAIA